MKKITPYLRLLRPANIVTSVADVLAGMAIAGFFTGWIFNYDHLVPVFFIVAATIGLYGGGIVFNDVFDAALDKVERPERPIPSGAVPLYRAVVLGSCFLAIGVLEGLLASMVSGIIAFAIAAFALLYNKISKHHAFWGPLNMGLCRGLNLLLGISIIPAMLQQWYLLALVPIAYIFSITMISQGEVHGGNRNKLYIAAVLYLLVITALLYCSSRNGNMGFTFLFLLLFAFMIFNPLFLAIQNPVGKNIGKAVKAGVISLILMDAAWAAGFNALYAALLIACLLPLSRWLAKRFAVT